MDAFTFFKLYKWFEIVKIALNVWWSYIYMEIEIAVKKCNTYIIKYMAKL